eukprot:TRINITY_DN5178_c0_g1_i1.p1 TRINITY_DN5178_c0_g1~~TRINITY_DN5178_c0_g1_i1.p1  ORF type:complete len:513 (-),score=99.18 TRINITY_DN5178_c0_g1_i1:30-1568(-)
MRRLRWRAKPALKRLIIVAEVVLVLKLTLWECSHIQNSDNIGIAHTLPDATDIFSQKWPFLFAGTIFLVEFLVCVMAMIAFKPSKSESFAPKSEGTSRTSMETSRLQEVTMVMAFIGFISGCYYLELAVGSDTERLVTLGSPFSGNAMHARIFSHFTVWAVLAPLQWIVFARLYTRASALEITSLALTTTLTMLLGLVSSSLRRDMEKQRQTYLFASCACVAMLFVQAFSVEWDPLMRRSGMKYMQFAGVLWSMYPVIFMLRALGWISGWQEQVVGYTLLDVLAKTVSLAFSSATLIMRLFMSTVGNLQIQSAMHDLQVFVSDPDWIVQPAPTQASLALQRHLLGCEIEGKHFIEHCIDTRAQRQAVLKAAQIADKQANFRAHKVRVMLRLSGAQKMPADIYVPRALWGKRQMAVTLLETKQLETTERDFELDAELAMARLPEDSVPDMLMPAAPGLRLGGGQHDEVATGDEDCRGSCRGSESLSEAQSQSRTEKSSTLGSAVPLYRVGREL